jgi:hypothetical protein
VRELDKLWRLCSIQSEMSTLEIAEDGEGVGCWGWSCVQEEVQLDLGKINKDGSIVEACELQDSLKNFERTP